MAHRGLRGRPIHADRAAGRQPAEPAAGLGLFLVAGRPGFLLARYELGGWPRWHRAADTASSVLRPARQPPPHGDARAARAGTQHPKEVTMTRSLTLQTALGRHPRMLLALPGAALAVTLAACGSSAGPSAHPAAPKPAGAAHSHAHSPPAHAAAPTPPKPTGAAQHHARPAPPAPPPIPPTRFRRATAATRTPTTTAVPAMATATSRRPAPHGTAAAAVPLLAGARPARLG